MSIPIYPQYSFKTWPLSDGYENYHIASFLRIKHGHQWYLVKVILDHASKKLSDTGGLMSAFHQQVYITHQLYIVTEKDELDENQQEESERLKALINI